MYRASPSKTKTFLGISSFQLLAMFRRALFYSYLSIYLRFFLGLTVTETTLFATLPMIINILCQNYIWGPVSDKLQLRRTLIIIGEVAAAIITTLVWFLHTLPEGHRSAGYILIIGLSLVEFFWSMSNVGWTALLSDLYAEHERAGLQGRLQSIGAVGRLVGIWAGGFMYDGFAKFYDGWGFDQGLLFFIASGVMLISTIPMFFIPEGGVQNSSEKVRPTEEADLFSSNVWRGGISKKYAVFLLAMVFIFFGFNSVTLVYSQYLSLDEGFDVTSRMLSNILSFGAAAVFITGLFVKPLSRKMKDEILLICGTAIALLYMIGFVLSINLVSIFFAFFAGGIALVFIESASYAYASKLIPPLRRGKQFALYNATMFLSWGIPGTFITGPLVDSLIKSGCSQEFSYRMSFVAAGIMIIVGMIIMIYNIRMNSGQKNGEIISQ